MVSKKRKQQPGYTRKTVQRKADGKTVETHEWVRDEKIDKAFHETVQDSQPAVTQSPPIQYAGITEITPLDTAEGVRDKISVNALQLVPQAPKALSTSSKYEWAAERALTNVQGTKTKLDLSESNLSSIIREMRGTLPRTPSSSEITGSPKSAKSKAKKNLAALDKDLQDQYRNRAQTEIDPTQAKKYPTKKSPIISTRKRLTLGEKVPKGKQSVQKWMSTNSDPVEKEWLNKQMSDPQGLFFGAKNNRVPGAYRRLQQYSNARQAGVVYDDKDNLLQWLTYDARGKKATSGQRQGAAKADKATTDELVKKRFTSAIEGTEGRKASDRYKRLAPSHEDLSVGIRVPGIHSKRELKEKFPDASDRRITEIRESEKMSVQEFLDNSRMAHEQRQASLLEREPSESMTGPSDRVIFFTTSTGHPAVSVSAQSLIGQYIIKKRKRMLYNQKLAPRAGLKGEFPYAVRDQHLVEVATGLSLGAQGRYGAFRHTGYRVGDKKSKGYGKMLPVGAQVLRDSSGQAMYDRNGNLRYTEGYTRPFDLRTSKEVGLRVYLG